jgi:hypothetical protein
VAAPAIAAPSGAADRFAHQAGALDFIHHRHQRRVGALLDIGMSGGKTAIALKAAETAGANLVLVLCPKAVLGVWPREIRKHSTRQWETWNGEVQGARGPLKNPSVARRAEAIVQATSDARKLRRPLLVAVNYDACWQGDMGRILRGTPWDAVIGDESHRIKKPGGKASWLCKDVGDKARARGGLVIFMSGTVTVHDELDLYSQLRAVDPSILGTSYANVRARYGARKVKFLYADGTPEYLTGPKGEPIFDGLRDDMREEFARRVAPAIYRVSQEEIDRNLGLGTPVDLYRTTHLDPATRRVYDALEKEGIAKVDGGVITAANAMIVVLRLAQATNGFGTDAETGAAHRIADPPEKARLLTDVLEDLPVREPVVAFCRFHHDLDAIQAAVERTGRTYGELSGRRRDGLTSDSEMSPDIDVLGCQLQSGGTGIDLTRSHTGIYYSLDFNLGDYRQSRKRLDREGQRHVVTFVHLLAENTVDRAIYGALQKREDTLTAFLDYMKGISR